MIWERQDKRQGTHPLKPLSAHRFLWDSQNIGGDSQSARLPIAPWVLGGDSPSFDQKGCIYEALS